MIAFAQANNATHIIIGKSSRTRWFEILHGSVVHDLVRRAGNISVHVIAGDAIEGEPVPRKTVRAAEKPPSLDLRAYGAAMLAVAAAVAVGELFWRWIRIENVDLLFLLAVVGVAVRFGLWPSLFASVLSGLCYNFFFTPPYYTFEIAYPALRRWRSSSSPSSRSSSRTSQRAPASRLWRPWRAPAPRNRSTHSAASSPASGRSTTCSGRPPTRPR